MYLVEWPREKPIGERIYLNEANFTIPVWLRGRRRRGRDGVESEEE